MPLNVKPNIDRPDDFYQALVDTHRDLSEDQSLALNAKLIVLLANHIGDRGVLAEALRQAQKGLEPSSQPS